MQESSYDEEVNELRALSQLTAQAVSGTTDRVQEVHKAIAGRVFRAIGPASAPVRITHDAISGIVYSSIRGISGLSGAVTAETLKNVPAAKGEHITEKTWGRRGVAALNAVVGDRLAQSGNELGIRASLYTMGTDGSFVKVDPVQPGSQVENPTNKLAIFLHGIGETEVSWAYRSETSELKPGVTYGSRLAVDLGFTPIWVRYNTGRKLVDNGVEIADLLEQLLVTWPVEPKQIALFGHSIGGLVCRAACDAASLKQQKWVGAVTHVMYLGTPHLGSPLERAAGAATWLLKVFPESAPFAKIVNVRSAGIQDLRFGYVDAGSAEGDNADDVMVIYVGDTPVVPLPQHADHCFITASARSSVQGLAGELMVFRGSASGKSGGAQRIGFDLNNGAHFDGVDHFAMVNDPSIYDQIRRWLETPKSTAMRPVPIGGKPKQDNRTALAVTGAAALAGAFFISTGGGLQAHLIRAGLLAGSLLVADRVAPVVTARIVTIIAKRGLGEQVTGLHSRVRGFPFLTQLARWRFNEVHLTAASFTEGNLEVQDLDGTMHQVRPLQNLQRAHVGSFTASALLPYSAMIAMLGPRLPSQVQALTFTAEADDVLTIDALPVGITVGVKVRVTLAPGNRIKIDFLEGDTKLLGRVLEPLSGAAIALRGLPYSLRADAIRLQASGVQIHVSARNVVLP